MKMWMCVCEEDTIDILGSSALHPSQQGSLGAALELGDHLPLHGRAGRISAGHALHGGGAGGQSLQSREVTGQLLNLGVHTERERERDGVRQEDRSYETAQFYRIITAFECWRDSTCLHR